MNATDSSKKTYSLERPYRSVGGVPLLSPFTLAALSGYSDMGMRMACRSLGACWTRHEVVLDQLVVDEGGGPRNGRCLHPEDHPIALQLMGSDPARMAEAAARMADTGYDMIDINFGCPVKKVLGRCRGGFLLGEPATAIAMLAAVRRAVTLPVTVKMRRGRDDSPMSREHFWRILAAAVDLGYAAVTVHGRTVQQRYEGPAQWNILAEAKQKYPNLIVFGSGDLYTSEDCRRMLQETGIDGVTLARGAINNPWVFRDCLAWWHGAPMPDAPSVREQGELLDWQYAMAIEQYGPERASRQIRKFGIKRAPLHPRADEVHSAFVNLSCPADWERVRREFFAEEPVALPACHMGDDAVRT